MKGGRFILGAGVALLIASAGLTRWVAQSDARQREWHDALRVYESSLQRHDSPRIIAGARTSSTPANQDPLSQAMDQWIVNRRAQLSVSKVYTQDPIAQAFDRASRAWFSRQVTPSAPAPNLNGTGDYEGMAGQPALATPSVQPQQSPALGPAPATAYPNQTDDPWARAYARVRAAQASTPAIMAPTNTARPPPPPSSAPSWEYAEPWAAGALCCGLLSVLVVPRLSMGLLSLARKVAGGRFVIAVARVLARPEPMIVLGWACLAGGVGVLCAAYSSSSALRYRSEDVLWGLSRRGALDVGLVFSVMGASGVAAGLLWRGSRGRASRGLAPSVTGGSAASPGKPEARP